MSTNISIQVSTNVENLMQSFINLNNIKIGHQPRFAAILQTFDLELSVCIDANQMLFMKLLIKIDGNLDDNGFYQKTITEMIYVQQRMYHSRMRPAKFTLFRHTDWSVAQQSHLKYSVSQSQLATVKGAKPNFKETI